MNKAFKFRIYPDAVQREKIEKTFNCVRFIYNKMLTDKIAYYTKTGKMLKNTPAQYKQEFPWLKEVDSLALANAQLNLQAAYNDYFSHQEMLYPRFKARKRCKKSYTTNCVNGNIVIRGGAVKLPKIGFVKMKLHRNVPSDYRLKSVTVSRDAKGSYYASILFEYELDEPEVLPESIVGLAYSDDGLYTDISGRTAMFPLSFQLTVEKYRREKQRLSHMKKGSKNREKQRIKTRRILERLMRQKRDFLHKQSRQIANDCDCVCMEVVPHTAENFNNWSMFGVFLKYKLEEAGKSFIKTDNIRLSAMLYSRQLG